MRLVCERFDTPFGELLIAATDDGVCRVAFPAEGPPDGDAWFERNFGRLPDVDYSPILVETAWQLSQYFRGRRSAFSVPLDLRGTPFQLAVWRRLLQLPFGFTMTYSEMARALGVARGARAVGSASSVNPAPILVPCHRLVGVGGGLVGFSGGIELKERLLELERARIPFEAWIGADAVPTPDLQQSTVA